MAEPRSVTAIVMAGRRPGGDELAARFGLDYKALIPVGGRSMLSRVVGTLIASPRVARIVVLAQDPTALATSDAAVFALDERVRFLRGGDGIATSILRVAGTSDAPWPILVTTADHVLLSPYMIDSLLDGAGDRDAVAGVASRRVVEASYSEIRRSWLKFADGHFSGANLFLLRSAAVEPALRAWTEVERHRKTPWKMFRSFGPELLLRALTRSIGLDDAVRRAGSRLGVNAGIVVLPQPESAIDVDKLADLELAETILGRRAQLAG